MNQHQCLTREALEATELVFVHTGDSKNALVIQELLKGPVIITQKESDGLATYDFYPLLISRAEIQEIHGSLSRAVRSGTSPTHVGECSVDILLSFWSQAQPAEDKL